MKIKEYLKKYILSLISTGFGILFISSVITDLHIYAKIILFIFGILLQIPLIRNCSKN